MTTTNNTQSGSSWSNFDEAQYGTNFWCAAFNDETHIEAQRLTTIDRGLSPVEVALRLERPSDDLGCWEVANVQRIVAEIITGCIVDLEDLDFEDRDVYLHGLLFDDVTSLPMSAIRYQVGVRVSAYLDVIPVGAEVVFAEEIEGLSLDEDLTLVGWRLPGGVVLDIADPDHSRPEFTAQMFKVAEALGQTTWGEEFLGVRHVPMGRLDAMCFQPVAGSLVRARQAPDPEMTP